MGNGASVMGDASGGGGSRFFDLPSDDIVSYLWRYQDPGTRSRERPQCGLLTCRPHAQQLEWDDTRSGSRESIDFSSIVAVSACQGADAKPFSMELTLAGGRGGRASNRVFLQAQDQEEWQKWLLWLPRLLLGAALQAGGAGAARALAPAVLAAVLIGSAALNRVEELQHLLRTVGRAIACPAERISR
jgi:hypothetical protein